jgi:WD40 repeat protein
MKTTCSLTQAKLWQAATAALTILIAAGCVSQNTSKPPLKVSPAPIGVREQLDEQAARIDRLYRALGPHLAELEERAAELEKQQAEDKALAWEPICRVADESLGSIGCMNPAAAEFGVLTTDGGVRIFDAGGKSVKELRQPGQNITCLAFAPDGSELLTGTDSGSLLVWNLANQKCSVLRTNVGPKVDRVAWLGKDRVAWGAMRTYWAEGGKPVDHDKPAGAVLDRASGEVIWTFRSFVRDDFYTLAGGMDGQQLAVLEIPGEPRGAFLLDGATGQVMQTCYDKEHGSGPLSVTISPDDNTLAVGYAPYDIILWDARTGARQKLLKGHSNWVVSLAFSTDGKRLISGAGDSTVRVWEVETGKEIGRMRFAGESTYVEGVGFSPKGDIVFATARGMLVVARMPAPSSNQK